MEREDQLKVVYGKDCMEHNSIHAHAKCITIYWQIIRNDMFWHNFDNPNYKQLKYFQSNILKYCKTLL